MLYLYTSLSPTHCHWDGNSTLSSYRLILEWHSFLLTTHTYCDVWLLANRALMEKIQILMLYTGQKTFSSHLETFFVIFKYLVILKPYAAENIVIPTWKLCISEFNECKICLFYDLLQCTIYPFWDKGTPGYTAYILLHRSLTVLSIILIFWHFVVKESKEYI